MIEIPGYRLKRTIGSGGMSTVYLAVQCSLDREVALKVMSPVLAADDTFAARFQREARTIAQLSHPNIVQVFDVGATDDHHNYFSMQYLPGGTLQERLQAPLDDAEALRVFAGILRALGFAHELGFVHRDVKPENVLFDASHTPVLTDFGIARTLQAPSRLTQTGVSVGTSRYMPPEQALGRAIDARSDLYSVGAVLFEALAGKPPYDAADAFAVTYAHVNEPIPPLPQARRAWEPLVHKAMAKEPAERFPSAAAMLAALEAMAHRSDGDGQGASWRAGAAPQPGPQRRRDQRSRARRPRRRAPARTQRTRIPPAIQSAFSRRLLARVQPWLPAFLQAPLGRAVRFADMRAGATRHWWTQRQLRGWRVAAMATGLAVVLIVAALWIPTRHVNPPPIMPGSDARAAGRQADATIDGSGGKGSPDTVTSMGAATVATPGTQAQPAAAASTDAAATAAVATDKEAQAGIPTLLVAAKNALEDYRLTTPENDNALAYYQAVLAQAPDNVAARQGLTRIPEAYLTLVANALDEGELLDAATFLARANKVAGKVPWYQSDTPEAAEQRVFDALVAGGGAALDSVRPERAQSLFAAARTLRPEAEQPRRMLARLQQPRRFSDPLAGGGSGPTMVRVYPGQFAMGDPDSGKVTVRIEQPFAIAADEISVRQFRHFVQASDYQPADSGCEAFGSHWWNLDKYNWHAPGFAQLDDYPVVCVSWKDAQAYAHWLSAQTGHTYRLPSEAEWEFVAVKGGSVREPVCRYANVGDQWLASTFSDTDVFDCADETTYTASSGLHPANRYGVHDIIGNASEWVRDCWHARHDAAHARQQARIGGQCGERVIKGSSWTSGPANVGPARRRHAAADDAYNWLGFRLVRELESDYPEVAPAST